MSLTNTTVHLYETIPTTPDVSGTWPALVALGASGSFSTSCIKIPCVLLGWTMMCVGSSSITRTPFPFIISTVAARSSHWKHIRFMPGPDLSSAGRSTESGPVGATSSMKPPLGRS